ncbi:MAG: PIN domain-containing protein [Chloroflexi bacterium]|nr:PIN domain-containing protein [Chloroflexota bacterium]
MPFLDTNILLRHLTQDHPQHSPKATAYLARIERGELQVRTADTVVFETDFTLQRFYRQPKEAIRDVLLPLIELPGIVLPGKRRFQKVFDLYVERNLSFADAYHAVLMRHLKLTEIVTWDRGFDRVAGIRRIEP